MYVYIFSSLDNQQKNAQYTAMKAMSTLSGIITHYTNLQMKLYETKQTINSEESCVL